MMLFRPFTAGLALLLSCLAAGGPALAAGVTVRDARDRDVTVDNPARTVSVGGAVTEILYALGLESRIVGVDTTSLYPESALRDKPNVGYLRQLSAEGVLGLNPSLILTVQGAGPKEAIESLEAARIPLVLVPETFTEKGIVDKIRMIGDVMGARPQAECLMKAVSADLSQMRDLRGKVKKPLRVMFVMSLLNGRAMAAGTNTAANEIIQLAGAVNAIEGYEGYKAINDEAIIAAKPDVVLSMQRGRDTLEADAVYAHPAFALTPAAQKKAFVAMDGLYLLGFGPRTAMAARDLAVQLYPEFAEQAGGLASAVATADCRR